VQWPWINREEETMAQAPSTESRDRVRATVPALIDYTEKVLFGDVWERPQLSKRDRSLIVCATLIATYRPEQLRGHLQRALVNGVTKEELSEVITHLAFYAGWPAAMTAANIAREVFEAN
jgi:4-carboxymuconolactone decarboxylase